MGSCNILPHKINNCGEAACLHMGPCGVAMGIMTPLGDPTHRKFAIGLSIHPGTGIDGASGWR